MTGRATFIEELTRAVGPLDPRWVAAFEEVPRGALVPYFFTQSAPDWQWRLVEADSPEWAEGVYSRRPLIIQIDGDESAVDRARQAPINGVGTSSSSAPTLMAVMLQALDLRDGDRVLEVGTGSGYNAGLLCHRLGDKSVTSIDVDKGLVEAARRRLAGLGYHPHVIAADGMDLTSVDGVFDRIIATVALPRVPAAWQAQLAPGGKILMPLDLVAYGGLLANLDGDEDGFLQGRFLADSGYFMPVRQRPYPDAAFMAEGGTTRETTLPVDRVRPAVDPFDFFVALRTGGFGWAEVVSGNGTKEVWLTARDGSWVCHTEFDGSRQVRQGGARRIWDEVEEAFSLWQDLGEPSRERFGLTVTPTQSHRVWLDDSAGISWPLP